jgi:hypothetical protein
MSIETSKTFNTTQLTDEQFRALLDAGSTVRDIETFAAQLEYRKAYNKRPDVIAKRKMYAAKRAAQFKALRAILNNTEVR